MSTFTSDTTALSLASPAARWAMIGVWCCGITSSVIRGEFPVTGWVGVATYLTLLAGALILTSRHPGRLSPLESAGLVTCALTGVAVILAFAHSHGDPAGEIWLLNYSSYLVALAIPRGNWISGGAAAATLGLIVVLWGAFTGQPLAGIVDMLAMPVSAGVVGVLWLVALRRSAIRLAEAQAAESRSQVASAAAIEATHLIAEDMRRVARTADPMLEHIELGRDITKDDQLELSAVEGEIRDRIRVPRLHHPRLVAAVAQARRAGADLVLMDPEGQRGPLISDGLAEALAQTAVGAGQVTIRLVTLDRQPAAQAVATDLNGFTHRHMFGPSGAELDESPASGVQR